MDEILRVAKRHDLLVIEDAAHAIEAWYHGRKIGNIGDLTCFSFYVTKNVVTGEGGMVTTNGEVWADRIRIYGLHGLSRDAWLRYSDEGYKRYEVLYPGFKYNMTDIQASLGIHQMKKVEERLRRREAIWSMYDEGFSDLPIMRPPEPEPQTVHARHLYTILVDKEEAGLTRDRLQEELHKMNIGTGIHFTALHTHPYYERTFRYRRGDFPHAEFVSDRTLSLPLSAKLTDEDVLYVIDVMKAVFVSLSHAR